MKTRMRIIGCLVALLLGGVAVAALGVWALGPDKVWQIIRTVAEEPYQISKRPMPANGDQDTLLPVTVGVFKRGDVTQSGNFFVTVYNDGTNTIEAQATVYKDVAQAQAFISDLREYDTRLIVSSTRSDPSYVADGRQDQATTLVYSRGPYVFFFKAQSSGPLALFMDKFPF